MKVIVSGWLLVCLLCLAHEVQAHGGGVLQVSNAPVGECLVSVWLAPATPRANKPLHVTVGLADAASQEPVLDGLVQVEIVEANSGQQVTVLPATTAQSVNRLFYEADIPPIAVGQYEVRVTPTCQGATGTVRFAVEVRPSTNPIFVALPLIIGGLLVGVWLVRQWRGRDTAVSPVKRREIEH